MRLNRWASGATALILAAMATGTAIGSVEPAAGAPARTARTSAATADGALPDATFGPSQREAAIASFQRGAAATASALHLAGGSALQVKDVVRDADGTEHVRYTRTYRGLPVVGGDLVVHGANTGSTADVTWDHAGNFGDLDVTPAVSAEQATAAVGSGAKAQLVVWGVDAAPRLAWRVTAPAAQGLHHVTVVDAGSGATIVGYDQEQTADAAGTGRTLYSGNVTIHTNKTAATRYLMQDLTRGGHRVTSMNGTEDTESATLADADNVWGNNAESSAQTVAADAQYGAAATWDFYQSLGRNGIRNDGVGARSRVHYGQNYDNAFWDDACFCMSYGDGNQFSPLVELDVAGHEMSHGVTSNSAGLLYFGESGGLNEATSDIFGTSVEFFANNATDPGDYYIGEKVASGFPGGALRRMDQPSLDGASYDCYSPLMGRDDVHYTSGVANHFFYLLSEGSGSKTIGGRSHSSTTCNGSRIVGITRAVADRIWYRALTVYMVPGTDYKDARDATIRAAADLYGATNARCSRVIATWNAVRVGAGAYNCAGPITPSTGPNNVQNPGFEATPVGTGWTQSDNQIIGAYGIARTGAYSGYLRGLGTAGTDTLSQTVAVPNTSGPKLVYWLLVDSAESGSTVFDSFAVQITSAGVTRTVQTSDNTKWDDSFHRNVVNLAGYRGKSVTLTFVGTEDSSLQSGFIVDDVSVS